MPAKIQTRGGDPIKSVRIIHNVFKDSFIQVQEEVGDHVTAWTVQDLKHRIRHERFDHEPLKPDYLAWKREHGYDTRKLIQTGQYVNSIRRWRLPNGNWVVGVPVTSYHHSGLPMKVLARIHEFGSSKASVPARPHWRPMVAMAKLRARQEWNHLVQTRLTDLVRRGMR